MTYTPPNTYTPLARFMMKVEIPGPLDGCWLWTAAKTQKGYGVFGATSPGVTTAHRWIYSRVVGVVPDGWVVDHLCRNHSCVNPDHLEAVTHSENLLRGHAALRAERRRAVAA
jgi:hypothetical protein